MLAIPRRARWAPVILIGLTAAACGRTDASRDVDDPTPPTVTLTAAGTLGHPSLLDVGDGSWLSIAPGAQVLLQASATDPDGVGRVELRVTEILVCPTGTYSTSHRPPPLVRAPESSRRATATAPSSLTTSYLIETSTPPAGCAAEWDVHAAATNAARTPVGASGPHARFGLDPLRPLPRPR